MDYAFIAFLFLSLVPPCWQLIITLDLAIFWIMICAFGLSLFTTVLAVLGSEGDSLCPSRAKTTVPITKII